MEPTEGSSVEEKKPEEPEKHDVPRMTEEGLREFVLGLCDDKIFCSAHIREHDLHLMKAIFMPLAFGAFSGWTKEEMSEIGVFWEWNRTAMPRSINGYPMFSSVRMLHVKDWERAFESYKLEMKRRKNIKM